MTGLLPDRGSARRRDLQRIANALDAAVAELDRFTPDTINATTKSGGDPVTAADLAVNDLLMDLLPADDEGWLSEETADTTERLAKDRVWVVDPIDGTREFVGGIPEWCVSIGLIECGVPVAGGICNPATRERILGAIGAGVSYSGNRPQVRASRLANAVVLASRSEVQRGEWDCYAGQPFTPVPMGSVAYKLALVAAGRADATWTLTPKHEWDVAAGTALVIASEGMVVLPSGRPPTWNATQPKIPGLVAATAAIAPAIAGTLDLGSLPA